MTRHIFSTAKTNKFRKRTTPTDQPTNQASKHAWKKNMYKWKRSQHWFYLEIFDLIYFCTHCGQWSLFHCSYTLLYISLFSLSLSRSSFILLRKVYARILHMCVCVSKLHHSWDFRQSVSLLWIMWLKADQPNVLWMFWHCMWPHTHTHTHSISQINTSI